MATKYKGRDRNRYVPLEELVAEEGGRTPEWVKDDEAARKRLQRDVYEKDGVGLIDPLVADIAPLTPPGMAVGAVGRAGEEIRKDPKNPRAYLSAVREFGESGAVDPTPGDSLAMIPTSKNIGRFREEMLKTLKKRGVKDLDNASLGDLTEAYMKVRRPVLTSPTGGNLGMIEVGKRNAENLGWAPETMGDSMPTLQTGKRGGLLSVARHREVDDIYNDVDTVSHELIHGAQRYRRPEMFDDYPYDALSNPSTEGWLKYRSHPTERQARQAGRTGKTDMENFMTQFVPEDNSFAAKYAKGVYESPSTRDLRAWLKKEPETPVVDNQIPTTEDYAKWVEEDQAQAATAAPQAREWIDPKGKHHDLGGDPNIDPKGEYHEEWSGRKLKTDIPGAVKKGYIRLAESGITTSDLLDPRMNMVLRKAVKKASEDGDRFVYVTKIEPSGATKEYTYMVDDIRSNLFNLDGLEPMFVQKASGFGER